ncbi:hypothetical protein F4777DRAFT_410880 [Nemania sp. FL0916]|nr:hypothetical protein F4777DRAFT_410880 [Nemania sp. FL0916]
MELDAHQLSSGHFGVPVHHMLRRQDLGLDGGRHSLRTISAPSSPSSRRTSPWDMPKRFEGSAKSQGGERSGSKSWPPSPEAHSPSGKEARGGHHDPGPSIIIEPLETENERKPSTASSTTPVPKPASAPPLTLPLRPQSKRIRSSDDVDGPGTAPLPCKKRRLLLRLITSRLSRPFSLPATHILIRDSSNAMPVLHRIQQLATTPGGARRAGHQSALVRKAAILNRVRIGVRQAAVSRGHTVMADLAARDNALDHGLLLVTTPASAALFPAAATVAGATTANPVAGAGGSTSGDGGIMSRGIGPGPGALPPAWRPHTTSFHPPIDRGHQDQQAQQYQYHQHSHSVGGTSSQGVAYTHSPAPPRVICMNAHAPTKHNSSSPSLAPTPTPIPASSIASTHTYTYVDASDEEDNTAFPAAGFRDRYADLSDDDMDDVYADFGVLFGSGSGGRSPEARAAVAGTTPVEEQFYEEYLDELDGIPWVV